MSKSQTSFEKVQSGEHYALGRAIKELRARRDLSQELLGTASNLHRNYIGAIERGEINPTFRVLLKVARGLEVLLSELFELHEQRREEHLLAYVRAKEAAR